MGNGEGKEMPAIMDEFQVKPSSEGCFTNAQPMWSFNNWGIVPGALLMPQCVAAAHQTLPPGFHVHSVQTQFLHIGTVSRTVKYRVEKLSDSKAFATRQVGVEQDGKLIAVTTAGFTKGADAVAAGRDIGIVEHAVVPAAMPIEAPRDEYDEICYIRGDPNPTIKGYTLPIVARGPFPNSSSALARNWLRIPSPIPTSHSNMENLLALIAISDIFFLDSGPRIYGLAFDMKTEPSPKDRMAQDFKTMTSINHNVHIANVDKVRVNEWVYVECEVPWASQGRMMLHSRIFSRDGVLLATCTQEGLLLLKKSTSDKLRGQKL